MHPVMTTICRSKSIIVIHKLLHVQYDVCHYSSYTWQMNTDVSHMEDRL